MSLAAWPSSFIQQAVAMRSVPATLRAARTWFQWPAMWPLWSPHAFRKHHGANLCRAVRKSLLGQASESTEVISRRAALPLMACLRAP